MTKINIRNYKENPEANLSDFFVDNHVIFEYLLSK